MPSLTITFSTESQDAFDASINALCAVHGFSKMIPDPGWKIGDEGNGSIENPEPREDFVKRMIFQDLVAKVTAQRQSIAAAISAQESAQVAAAFTAE